MLTANRAGRRRADCSGGLGPPIFHRLAAFLLRKSTDYRECRRSQSAATGLHRANGADEISDMEGKAARVAASECGLRASFNASYWSRPRIHVRTPGSNL